MESIDCVAKNASNFEHKFDKVLKKHSRCLVKDFEIIKQTILTRKEELLKESPKRNERVQLGEKYSKFIAIKSRMRISDDKDYSARVIWHLSKERKEILFIDIYLKNHQENHDIELIKKSLDTYYK
ncbi:MAG: hypothetical protein WCX73_00860 [Candidatus Pacearchaeota archaeon]|jgi:hypothetical protein